MATCTNCLKNCDPLVFDKCVKYTLEDNTTLGTTKGSSLFEWETIIEEKLTSILSQIDDGIEDMELCNYVDDILGSDTQNIVNLIQTLMIGECNLDARLIALETVVDTPFSFDTKCLTGSLTSRDLILQATINNTCANATRLTTIEDDYVKQSDLCTQVAVCLEDSASTQFNSRMVPYAPIPYIGALSNFDNTGKGLSSVGFDKVYLMNGQNGTQDWRGRSPIGAIYMNDTFPTDSAVNPSVPANAAYNYVLNSKYGASTTTLTVPQMPAHTHGVVDPGHRHTFSDIFIGPDGIIDDADKYTKGTGNTSTAVTGISISSAGGGQAHNNVHPTIGTYFIVYIP